MSTPNILRTTKSPGAPSGREVKRILREQFDFMLDQMFHNHMSYPNVLAGVQVEAYWTAIKPQAKTLELESTIEGPIAREDQMAINAGEAVLEDGSAIERVEVNLNPKAQKEGKGVQRTQPKLKANQQQPAQSLPAPSTGVSIEQGVAPAPGLVAPSASAHIVNTRKQAGELPKEALEQVERGTKDAVGQLQVPKAQLGGS